MKSKLLLSVIFLAASHADAVLVSLNDVTIGSETTVLVANGGFELGAGNQTPTGWTRSGNMFYDTPTTAALTGFSNLPSNKVAYYSAPVSGSIVNGLYQHGTITLTANTSYVLSVYMWNNAGTTEAGNRNMVIDMNDVTGEAQLVLRADAVDAADGYFAYQTFNTGTTGTSINLRIFTNPTTYATAGKYHVWDNVAITQESVFTAPTPIPEPAAALLGGIGLLGLLVRRRRI